MGRFDFTRSVRISDAIGFITSNDIVPVDCNSESNFCHTFLGLTQSKKV